MKQFQITINDTSYEVEILDDPRQEEVQVRVNGEEYTVKTDLAGQPAAVVASTPVQQRVSTPMAAPATSSAPVAAGPGTIKSPLPGVIVSVKVSSGQQVKANDELCVIEAMKAMNVIRAPRDGKVAKVYVAKGVNVAHGAPLMDIE